MTALDRDPSEPGRGAHQDRTSLRHQVVALAAGGVRPAAVTRAVAALREAGGDVTATRTISWLARTAAAAGGPAHQAAVRDLDRAGASVLIAGEPGYPGKLSPSWPDLGAPLWLFVRSPDGRLPTGPAVAVVGTRHPSLDGLETARALGACLAHAGITVVSGLARGIDQASHRGALDAGGRTVAVLGTGFGVDYPRGDEAVREEVAASGGLVTELLPGVPPRGYQFLERNRIIAGLADATVVVEGRTRSGALATAQRATEQGREVLACPGSINAPRSRAPLDLIRDGASVLTRLEDAVEAAGVSRLRQADPLPRSVPNLDAVAAEVLDLLGTTPAGMDALVRASGRPVGEVLSAAGELVARGLADRQAGGLVRRPDPA